MPANSRLASLIVICCLVAAIASFSQSRNAADKEDRRTITKEQPDGQRKELPDYGFPDFGYVPAPEEIDRLGGKVFKLSQQYPKKLPAKDKVPPFINADFKQNWRQYAEAVRAYCLAGNIDVDFRVEDNKPHPQRWFHAPGSIMDRRAGRPCMV